ncbi:MAG TPA: ComF family protein [Halothiobacillus sp.]|nr:ComF family protein [Halothiobacillus sp.]
MRHLIHRLKFSADFAAARPLARVMANAVAADVSRDDLPELLLPVPLHPSRLRERGYNQAGELASRLGKLLGIPVGHSHGERLRYTVEQSGLDAATRRRNIRGAFVFVKQLPPHVAIVDDVMTTGSTVREVARVALRAGAKHIEVWCAARAGR